MVPLQVAHRQNHQYHHIYHPLQVAVSSVWTVVASLIFITQCPTAPHMSWYVFFHYSFIFVMNQKCLTNHFLSLHANRTSNQAVDARCLLQTQTFFPANTANNAFLNFPVPDMYKPMNTICPCSARTTRQQKKNSCTVFSVCSIKIRDLQNQCSSLPFLCSLFFGDTDETISFFSFLSSSAYLITCLISLFVIFFSLFISSFSFTLTHLVAVHTFSCFFLYCCTFVILHFI